MDRLVQQGFPDYIEPWPTSRPIPRSAIAVARDLDVI
jgi:hypothetical protein